MAKFALADVALRGVASCVPKSSERNDSFSLFSGDEAQKFSATTGVYSRRVSRGSVTTSDMCCEAAEVLLRDLGWSKESVEALIFVTQTPDYVLPATSCLLQDRLGLSRDTYTLDISLGCSGWVYGVSQIASLLKASGMKRGLLLCGDTISEICSKSDKSTYPLFGDAGTASAFELVEGGDAESKIYCSFNSDGAGADAIIVKDGAARNGVSASSFDMVDYGEGIERNALQLSLSGMDVFSFGISKAPKSVKSLLEFAGKGVEDIDYALFHQANLMMNEKIRKKLGLSEEQVPYSMDEFGNTSSATIPLTMTTRLANELQGKDLRLVACGFGVGLSWGSIYLETSGVVCSDLIEI